MAAELAPPDIAAMEFKRESTFFEATTTQSGWMALNRRSKAEIDQGSFIVASAGQTTTLQALMTIVTTIIGAGILGFPKIFSIGGWFWSPIMLVICAWAAIETGHCINDALQFVTRRQQDGEQFSFIYAVRYDDICEAAFGSVGKMISAVLVNGYLLMVGSVFIILISLNINFLTGLEPDYAILAIAVCFVPISLLDDMTVIAKLSGIGVIASIIYAFSIGIAGFQATSFPGEREYTVFLTFAQLGNIGQVISVMLTGFTYQIVGPTIRSEMQKPQDFPKAVTGGVTLVALVYAAAGSIGYYGWGNAVTDQVTDSMILPSGERMIAGTVLAVAIIANLFVTFPIVMNCVYRAAETALETKYSIPARLVLLMCSLVIGRFLPFFLPILTLIGATIGVCTVVFLPVALYWTLAKAEGITPGTSPFKVLKHAVLLVLGSIALFLGTQGAIIGLIGAINAQPAAMVM